MNAGRHPGDAGPVSVLTRILTEPFRARAWRETGHLLLGVFVSALSLAFVIASLYAAVASVLVIGLALLAALVLGARFVGHVERARARVVLGVDLPTLPPRRRVGTGLVGRVRDALTDRAGWQCLGYAVLAVPTGIVQAYAVALGWGLSLTTLTYPLVYRLAPAGWRAGVVELGQWRLSMDVVRDQAVLVALGAAGVLAVPWLVHGLVALDRLRFRLLTVPPAPADRLATAERRRGHAVEQAGAQLRRIERDLHDGAQVRMVALAMELGRARADLERGADPALATARVAAAHEEAKQALVELRELARGIYPAVLTDLGLDGAVPVLTARCPVPVTVDIDVPRRPGPAAEATAYFCIGELLANIGKHSGAAAASVRARRHGDRLTVEVHDDGPGGAVVVPGGGLAGLADRTDSVGGRITVSSPSGGPTVVTVELPCGS